MDQRDRIIDVVGGLAATRGRMPSILEVATEVGLTKQGVLHYFPSRAALDDAVIARAVARVDDAMNEAAADPDRSPTATYLRLSAPHDADHAAATVVLAAATRGVRGLPPGLGSAVARWQDAIARELGDPVRAEVVRLAGDGLLAEALISGVPPAIERVDRLVAHLLEGTPGDRP